MYKNGKFVGNIYLIVNTINGKKYVGQTVNELYDRWSGHKHDARRREYHTVIEKAIKKYGPDVFDVSLLEKVFADSEDELHERLNEREIYYIEQEHSMVHDGGYNVTPGGNQRASKHKKKTYCFTADGELCGIFDSRHDAGKFIGVKGEDISATILRNGLCRGYYFSSSPNFNWSKPNNLMSTQPVNCYDKKGNLCFEFANCYEAARSVDGDIYDIFGTCTGTHTSYRGYIWRFKGEDFDQYRLPTEQKRCVNQYTKDNGYVNTYLSIKDAARICQLHASNISAVLSRNSPHKTTGGFCWYYANDPNQPDKTKIIDT